MCTRFSFCPEAITISWWGCEREVCVCASLSACGQTWLEMQLPRAGWGGGGVYLVQGQVRGCYRAGFRCDAFSPPPWRRCRQRTERDDTWGSCVLISLADGLRRCGCPPGWVEMIPPS